MNINANVLDWLLEEDANYPSVRYLTMRDILGMPEDDPRLRQAQQAVMETGPVPAILEHQDTEGWWDRPGRGYAAKYFSTVWSMIFLAQLGADGNHPQIRLGGNYLLQHARTETGGFTATTGSNGMVQCLQGNLCAALLDLGWWGDPRLDEALDWLACSVTGEGIAPATEKHAERRFYSSGNCGPGFACAANLRLPCAWGAVKALLALAKVPPQARTAVMQDAIAMGVNFLLEGDPAAADYPTAWTGKPSQSWWQYGFPVFYVTDMVQNLEALRAAGVQPDCLQPAFDKLLSQGEADGRWKMRYSYQGKTWAEIEKKGKPSKFVTYRALKILGHG